MYLYIMILIKCKFIANILLIINYICLYDKSYYCYENVLFNSKIEYVSLWYIDDYTNRILIINLLNTMDVILNRIFATFCAA